MPIGFAVLILCVLVSRGMASGQPPVFATPSSPWEQYRETASDPEIGKPYVAYRLDLSKKQPQELIVYRLFTMPRYDIGIIQQALKGLYQEASFTQPRPVELCNGLAGSSFEYTYDFNHDGHLIITREIVAQGTALYAIVYRRSVDQSDDGQALRALQTFCPPKVEPLPIPPPFVIPADFAEFSSPPSFERLNWQTINSLGWVKQTPSGTAVVTLRHQPTLFTSIAQYGAEQRRLADDKAPVLNGFRDYTLIANRAERICATSPTEAWYVEIRGNYFGTMAVEYQLSFLQRATMYSAAYLRSNNVAVDADALTSLHSTCPRPLLSIEPDAPSGVVAGKEQFVVSGNPLTNDEVVALYKLIFTSASTKHRTVWKNPNEMPAYASDMAYAGKDSAGTAIMWSKRGVDSNFKDMSDAEQVRIYREAQAAGIAAALDAGEGGPLQTLVRSRTPEALTMLANGLLGAIRGASRQTVANSLATQRWISEHIVPGMNRAAVVAELSAHGIKSKSLVRQLSNCKSDVVTHWMYQGTYPDSECASPSTERHPVLNVDLAGAFQPGCSFATYVDVIFDERDLVQRLALSNPISDCL